MSIRPPMHQAVSIDFPVLDASGNPIRDSFDRAQVTRRTTTGRVQRKVAVVTDANGKSYRTTLEVDLPPEFAAQVNMKGTFEVPGEGSVDGVVRASEAITNLTGLRVEYRTVFVDG